MEKVMHTPGPWKIETATNGKVDWMTIDANGSVVCKMVEMTSQAVRNAKLIAAAPELLKALELLTQIGSQREFDPIGHKMAVDHAKEIIKSATK